MCIAVGRWGQTEGAGASTIWGNIPREQQLRTIWDGSFFPFQGRAIGKSGGKLESSHYIYPVIVRLVFLFFFFFFGVANAWSFVRDV